MVSGKTLPVSLKEIIDFIHLHWTEIQVCGNNTGKDVNTYSMKFRTDILYIEEFKIYVRME